jgi:hypothetical protein
VHEETPSDEEDDDQRGRAGEGAPPRERQLGHVAYSGDEGVTDV